ncbi:helix-turn-helix domain-containing protein [Micromonospora craniellae]|uniref:helix-turn-helix domain-containing protein n=1 Tax=Micromonospora craniellae TaxID=2294034 RepID=UPI001CC64905|nr:helix-turn-helix transcriptional regulator [Micromonospora craniellae]
MAPEPTPPLATIAAALRYERRVDISLTELARRAGIARSALSQLESGVGNPSVETLWELGVALDVGWRSTCRSAGRSSHGRPRSGGLRDLPGRRPAPLRGPRAGYLRDAGDGAPLTRCGCRDGELTKGGGSPEVRPDQRPKCPDQ